MSHELSFPELVIEPTYDWGDNFTITGNSYFYVPSIPEWAYSEFDGLVYEGVQYNWDEVDYRLTVDYPSVPEPSFYGLLLGFIFLLFAMIKKRK